MKKYLALLLLVPGLAAAQTPIPFVLKGRLGSDTYRGAPTYVYLRGGMMLDSAVVEKGRFELKGTVDMPIKAYLTMRRHGDMSDYKAVFFLEQGTLLFTSPDSLKNAQVGGTPLTDAWREIFFARSPIIQQLNALEKEFQAATPEQQQSLAFRQKQARRAALSREATRLDSAFVRAHPTSFISLTVLNTMSKDPANAALVMTLLPTLSPAAFNDPQAEEIRTRIQQNALGLKPKPAPALQVGQLAPNFTQATPDGRQVSLADYRGKYVLVDFWASWCGPCRQENPTVVKAYNAYKGKNFDVLSVSLDEARDRAKWVKAIQDDQLPWTQVADLKGWEGQAARAYSVRAIPQNFLVDPTGKIVAMNLRGDALPEALAQLVTAVTQPGPRQRVPHPLTPSPKERGN